MLVIGKNEAVEKTVSLRSRLDKSLEGSYQVNEAVALLQKLIQERTLPQSA